jgi:hypothetical protein
MERSMKKALTGAVGAVLMAAAGLLAPPAGAITNPFGNWNMNIPDRFDFHTWIWSVGSCVSGAHDAGPPPECIHVFAIAQPIAKAFNYRNDVHLVDGRYTLAVDDPYGLRCGNVYYGPTSMTHDVYSWDAVTNAGTLTSSFDAGCDGQPGTLTYPFWLTRL